MTEAQFLWCSSVLVSMLALYHWYRYSLWRCCWRACTICTRSRTWTSAQASLVTHGREVGVVTGRVCLIFAKAAMCMHLLFEFALCSWWTACLSIYSSASWIHVSSPQCLPFFYSYCYSIYARLRNCSSSSPMPVTHRNDSVAAGPCSFHGACDFCAHCSI